MSLAELIEHPGQESESVSRALTRRVLLLGNDDRVLLAVARGLGREGLTVHIAWCDPDSPALRSRYVTQYHALPAYQPQSVEWLESLNGLAEQEDYDLVIPCNDFAVIPLQNQRESLRSGTLWYLINDEAFDIAFDKANTSNVARALAIKTPLEYSVTHDQINAVACQDEVTQIAGETLRFPVYVKPRSSITETDVENKRSAQRIESAAELAESFREGTPDDGLLIQENFVGVGIGVEVLASQGKVLMQLQHRRLRETIDGGSTYRESIAEIAELTEATAKLVARLDYTGVAMFEYRFCPETKDWVFLEINGRFWGSLPLAIASGANFPFGLYQLLVNNETTFDNSYKVGTRCRNLVTDLRAYRKQTGTPLHLMNMLLCRDHFDFFAIDDWRPQQNVLGKLFGSVTRKLLRR